MSLPPSIVAPISPYTRWNLRRNPFGELTREERAEVALVDVEPWLAKLSQGRTALQFLGPCGHGKTTHLLALERVLPGAVYIYLPEDGRRPSIPRARPLILDEAQRLGRWQRRRVFGQIGQLILGSHEDHTAELVRARYRVVTEHVARLAHPRRLQQLLNRRIEASRAGPGPLPWINEPCATELHQRFGANIRQIERYLYDQFQQRVQEDALWQNAP